MKNLLIAVALLLTACSPDLGQGGADLAAEQAAAPTLRGGALVRGTPTRLVFTGFASGQRVTLVASASAVAGAFCPAALGGVCSDVGSPGVVLGTVTADPRGVATFTVTVPARSPLSVVQVEAVARGGRARTGVLSVLVVAPDSDDDIDGVVNRMEAQRGTSPVDADSDDDGLDDGEEDDRGTDALDSDSDDDGMDDGAEDDRGTDALDSDSDDDGMDDGEEDDLGTDPLDMDSDDDGRDDGEEDDLGTDPLDMDSDDDGSDDGEEDDLGTDPLDVDSDDDGLDDGEEDDLGTDPLDSDSDDDGSDDGEEDDLGTDPLDSDSDDDGVEDGEDTDDDGLGDDD